MRSKGLSILLVTLGVLLLGAAAILFVVRQAQDKQRAAEIPSLIEKIEAALPERSAGVIENRADSAMAAVEIDGIDVIGLLELPGRAGGIGNASGGEDRLRHYGAADRVVFRGRYDLLWPDQTAADAGVHRVWGDLLRHADVHDRTVLRGAVQRRGYDRAAGSGGQRSGRTAGTAAGQGSKTNKNQGAPSLICTNGNGG